MANEIEWLRNKAKFLQSEIMIVTPDEAIAAECLPGNYQIDRYGFTGTIPFRMARALSGAKLVKTDVEQEVLHLGTGYRGGEGMYRYYRSVYKLITE